MVAAVGYSPYFLMFAREPRLPADAELSSPSVHKNRTVAEYVETLCARLRQALEFAVTASNRRHARNKRTLEKRLNEHVFAPGDDVLLFKDIVPKGQYYKFVRPWKPAQVIKQVGEVNYRVRLHGRRNTILVHHNRLRPAPAPLGDPDPLPQPSVSQPQLSDREPAEPVGGSVDADRSGEGRALVVPSGSVDADVGSDLSTVVVGPTSRVAAELLDSADDAPDEPSDVQDMGSVVGTGTENRSRTYRVLM